MSWKRGIKYLGKGVTPRKWYSLVADRDSAELRKIAEVIGPYYLIAMGNEAKS